MSCDARTESHRYWPLSKRRGEKSEGGSIADTTLAPTTCIDVH
jgi:hypothetical protein